MAFEMICLAHPLYEQKENNGFLSFPIYCQVRLTNKQQKWPKFQPHYLQK